jgi:hypothetical protein
MIRRAAIASAVALLIAPLAPAWSDSGARGGSGSNQGHDKLIPVPVDSAAPDVRAAASPTVVRLGAHFTLYVTATFGAGVEVNLREPVELGPAFEVRRRLSEDLRTADGRTTREWQIDVMPWELGELPIAPIAVTFTAFGRAGQVQTNAVPMKIIGDLGDLVDDPKAMRGLALPTALWTRDWFWIGVATAGCALVGVLSAVVWLYRRRRRRTIALVGGVALRAPRVDMTGERALERLLAIERSCVLERDRDRKTGYTAMVEVIREYLGARYRIAVHDLTSSELLRRLDELARAGELAPVRDWFDATDLVKYGGQHATPAEAGKALDDARALIVTTTRAGAGAPRAPAPARPATHEAA